MALQLQAHKLSWTHKDRDKAGPLVYSALEVVWVVAVGGAPCPSLPQLLEYRLCSDSR